MSNKLEQAAEAYSAKRVGGIILDDDVNAFKAGAEWRLEQVKADLKLILENFQKRAEHGEKAFEAGCPEFYQGQIVIISRLLTWCREYKRKIEI